MKKILFLLFTLLSVSLFAVKTKLIIQSKDDIRLIYLKNTKTNIKTPVSTWNKIGGGFLVEVENTKDYNICTNKKSTFRLFIIDKKQSTKWIDITNGKSISINDCFTKFLDNVVSDKDIMKTASEFLVSNYLGNSMQEETASLRGAGDKLTFVNEQSVYYDKDVTIKWNTTLKIKTIYLIDMVTIKRNKCNINDSNYITIRDLAHKEYKLILIDENDIEYGTCFSVKNKPEEYMVQDSVKYDIKSLGKLEKNKIYTIKIDSVDHDFYILYEQTEYKQLMNFLGKWKNN